MQVARSTIADKCEGDVLGGKTVALSDKHVETNTYQHRHLYGAQELERIFQAYGFCPSFLGKRRRNDNSCQERQLWGSVLSRAANLRAGNFQTKFFREAFANFRGQAIVHSTRSHFRCVNHGHRCGGGYCHCNPDQRRKGKAQQRGQFQPEAVARTKMAYHTKRQ